MITYCPSRERHTPSDIAGSDSSYTSVPGPMPLLDTLYRHNVLARPVSLVCSDTATFCRNACSSSAAFPAPHSCMTAG